MNNKQRLLFYLKKERKLIILSLILIFVFVVSQLLIPFILGKTLDIALDNQDETKYKSLIFVCFLLVIFGSISNFFFELLVGKLSQNIVKNIRKDIYKKIISVPMEAIHKSSQGDLLQLEITDMENVINGITSVFKSLVQGILLVVITIVLMMLANWILAVLIIVLTPLSVLMARFVTKINSNYFKKLAKTQANLTSYSLESIDNIDLVKSLNYEKQCLDIFHKKNSDLKGAGIKALFSASWINPCTRLVNNTIYVLVGIIGIIFIYNSSLSDPLKDAGAILTIGTLSSFLSYTNQYTRPFNDISSVASEYSLAKSSFSRINRFLNIENDSNGGETRIKHINKITFKDMSFSYDKSKKLIENFNFEINKGNKIAIVGHTGAGKTTIINLIMRFYNPISGNIYYNETDGMDIDKHSIRKHFGMVLQDSWIFTGTVMDNIRYYKPTASDEEVIAMAKKTRADSFISMLPDGYSTIVSSSSGLSEGEKQMICITRIMLSDPDIIILDEATSNIDTRSEKLISSAIDQMMKNKTSIIIAHRLSTIVHADLILVVDKGNIVEQGTHSKLLEKKGVYYSLYSSQFK